MAVTFFVDHFCRLQYIHLITNITSEETVRLKKAFEHFAESHGVHIQYYHCNNGCFPLKAFIADCEQNKQHITYCQLGTFKNMPKISYSMKRLDGQMS